MIRHSSLLFGPPCIFPFPLLAGLESRLFGSVGNSPASPLGHPGLLTIRHAHSPLYCGTRHRKSETALRQRACGTAVRTTDTVLRKRFRKRIRMNGNVTLETRRNSGSLTFTLIHPASPMHRATRWPTNVCLELMFQPLPRLIPFFGGPNSLPHLSSSALACQVFSWIPQLPSAALAAECVLHPFSRHDQAIPSFFLGSLSQEVFVLFFSVLLPFVIWSLQVIPRMPLNHLWCAAFSFLLNVTVRGHNSAPYRRVDKISASYSLSFVCRLMCLFLQTFFILPNIVDAFPIRTFTSFL